MSWESSELTCSDNTPYVDPKEEILVEDYDGKHQYVIFKKRPALSRTSEEDADDFDIALEPGTWIFKFAIKPSDKSLEVWFGRKLLPESPDLLALYALHEVEPHDHPDPLHRDNDDEPHDPDIFEYKCIAIFSECTSIRVLQNYGNYYEVSYGSGGTESMKLPIHCNADRAQFPWNDLTQQFSKNALRKAIDWANETLSMLTVHGCLRQLSTLNRYCIQR
jgi:hypothetical protein